MTCDTQKTLRKRPLNNEQRLIGQYIGKQTKTRLRYVEGHIDVVLRNDT